MVANIPVTILVIFVIFSGILLGEMGIIDQVSQFAEGFTIDYLANDNFDIPDTVDLGLEFTKINDAINALPDRPADMPLTPTEMGCIIARDIRQDFEENSFSDVKGVNMKEVGEPQVNFLVGRTFQFDFNNHVDNDFPTFDDLTDEEQEFLSGVEGPCRDIEYVSDYDEKNCDGMLDEYCVTLMLSRLSIDGEKMSGRGSTDSVSLCGASDDRQRNFFGNSECTLGSIGTRTIPEGATDVCETVGLCYGGNTDGGNLVSGDMITDFFAHYTQYTTSTQHQRDTDPFTVRDVILKEREDQKRDFDEATHKEASQYGRRLNGNFESLVKYERIIPKLRYAQANSFDFGHYVNPNRPDIGEPFSPKYVYALFWDKGKDGYEIHISRAPNTLNLGTVYLSSLTSSFWSIRSSETVKCADMDEYPSCPGVLEVSEHRRVGYIGGVVPEARMLYDITFIAGDLDVIGDIEQDYTLSTFLDDALGSTDKYPWDLNSALYNQVRIAPFGKRLGGGNDVMEVPPQNKFYITTNMEPDEKFVEGQQYNIIMNYWTARRPTGDPWTSGFLAFDNSISITKIDRTCEYNMFTDDYSSVSCTDADGDGYCVWDTRKKPDHCTECKPAKDCDDSDATNSVWMHESGTLRCTEPYFCAGDYVFPDDSTCMDINIENTCYHTPCEWTQKGNIDYDDYVNNECLADEVCFDSTCQARSDVAIACDVIADCPEGEGCFDGVCGATITEALCEETDEEINYATNGGDYVIGTCLDNCNRKAYGYDNGICYYNYEGWVKYSSGTGDTGRCAWLGKAECDESECTSEGCVEAYWEDQCTNGPDRGEYNPAHLTAGWCKDGCDQQDYLFANGVCYTDYIGHSTWIGMDGTVNYCVWANSIACDNEDQCKSGICTG
jgi:hypothetical protein